MIRTLCNYVFSFGMFCTLCFIGFISFMYLVITNDNEEQEKARMDIEICYNQGMVLVETDAGPRCADIKTMMKLPK